MDESPVADLFPEETWSGSDVSQLVEAHHRLRLIYPETPHGNPNGYIFRGELDYARPLESTLERKTRNRASRGQELTAEALEKVENKCVTDFVSDGGQAITDGIKAMDTERWERAKRRLKNELKKDGTNLDMLARIDAVDGDKILERHDENEIFWWLSVMQHYGHPTRLVDFSTDFTIALFMAVQQFRRPILPACLRSSDIIIYCFPCRDLNETDQNKTPITRDPEDAKKCINMHVALAVQMGRLEEHPANCSTKRKPNQTWGWDRPFYETPRLWFQKGMFVYPFDPLKRPLDGCGESWLVSNLRQNKGDPFCIAAMGKKGQHPFPPKRIRIPRERGDELEAYLEKEGLSPAPVFLNYADVRSREP